MRKFNNYIKIGLLFNAIFLVGNTTGLLPEFINGFCVGLGLVLIFMGMYSEKHVISRLREIKRRMLVRRR